MSLKKKGYFKSHSGLASKNLICFNKAILVKQCRMLLHSTDTLVARILKTKYFSKGIILNARLSGQPYFQRGIYLKTLRSCDPFKSCGKKNVFLKKS